MFVTKLLTHLRNPRVNVKRADSETLSIGVRSYSASVKYFYTYYCSIEVRLGQGLRVAIRTIYPSHHYQHFHDAIIPYLDLSEMMASDSIFKVMAGASVILFSVTFLGDWIYYCSIVTAKLRAPASPTSHRLPFATL